MKTTTAAAAKNNAVIAAAFNEVYTDTKRYEVDKYGRTVRTDRAGHDEIRHFLLNQRVVDSVEILAEVGAPAFEAMVNGGYLRRSADFNKFSTCNLYWVTEKARDNYDLPRKIKLPCGFEVAYAK